MKIKKIILISVAILASYLGLHVSDTSVINHKHFFMLENIEALAHDELWSRDKFTEIESYTKTRINQEQEHYYEKHTIECQQGGIMPSCTPICETREVSFGNATSWEPC